MIVRRLVRADSQQLTLPAGMTADELRGLLNATVLDVIALQPVGWQPHVMLVDDLAIRKELPLNVEATSLYLATHRPGGMHKVRGDVIYYPAAEFDKALL